MADLKDTIKQTLAPVPTEPRTLVLPQPPPAPPAVYQKGNDLADRRTDGRWAPGKSANPGGRTKALAIVRARIRECTEDGWLLVKVLIDQAFTGYDLRPDGTFTALTAGERKAAATAAWEMLHGKGVVVKGKVRHSGRVDVKAQVKVDSDVGALSTKLAHLSDADLERLEALADVLMPVDPVASDITDAELLEVVEDSEPPAGDPSDEAP